MAVNTGSGFINLGGASVSSLSGMTYRIDGGTWKSIYPTKGDYAACGTSCKYNNWHTYVILELDNNPVFYCEDDTCVPDG
jgi:hypothetical protein